MKGCACFAELRQKALPRMAEKGGAERVRENAERYNAQFSIFKPGTRINSRTLFVTSVLFSDFA